jgi:hypothetical protein
LKDKGNRKKEDYGKQSVNRTGRETREYQATQSVTHPNRIFAGLDPAIQS